MSADTQTLGFYTREAARYADHTDDEANHPRLVGFAEMVVPGGAVLDFGCGPGWAANVFKNRGFKVSGFDGSAGLAAEAKRRYGIDVTVGAFEEFSAQAMYDGIWCSFCLLHDSREAMPGHLHRLARALRTNGAFYLGLKEGTGAERDSLGRLYTYFSQGEITGWLSEAGFATPEVEIQPGTSFDGAACSEMHFLTVRR